MHICYVANSRFPSERAHMTHIVQMCNAFAKNGNDVTLVVTNRPSGIEESPEIYFGTKINFSVVRVSVPNIAGWSPRIPKVLRPFLFQIQRLVFAIQTTRHLRKHQYSQVYGRDEWVLFFISFLTNIAITWESHEARFSYAGRKLLKKHIPIVVISEGIRNFYIRQGVSENTLLVAHDAVDESFFTPHISVKEAREALGINIEKPVVMYIGGLETGKGAHILFEATRNQDIFETYVIGGKESDITGMREKYPFVHFLGPKPYRELPKHQQAGDILIIPNTAKDTVSAEYTSPLKLFAYMTAKKPIVASYVQSISKVLSDDEVFFFEPDNSNELRKTIISVLQNNQQAKEKAERAYKKSFQYTWQKRAFNILTFLNSQRKKN